MTSASCDERAVIVEALANLLLEALDADEPDAGDSPALPAEAAG